MKITTKEEAKAKLEEAIQIQIEMQKFLNRDDSKEELFKERDEWFLGILRDLKVGRIEPSVVEYHNHKNELMIQECKNMAGIFWCQYDRTWLILKEKYYMKYPEIETYLKDQLVTHLNWKVEKIFNPAIGVLY